MMADLDAFIDARRSTAFAYFNHDCAHVAADWVREATGVDALAPLRGDGGPLDGESLLRALRFVRQAGGRAPARECFIAAGEFLLGPSVPGLAAHRGDVVLVRSGGRVGRVSGYGFGVCTGAHVVAPGADRLGFLPITAAEAAWRI